MKKITFFLFLSISISSISQEKKVTSINDALKKYNFIEEKIIQDKDTITYYLKNYKSKPKNLVVFIQGTDANPIFSYRYKNGKMSIYRWFNNDYSLLDSTYTYTIIPKPGIEGIHDEANFSIPKKYYEKNYLDYRIKQVDVSINHIIKNHLKNPEKVIVYGHSEGATIAAPLALQNKNITHLGFWSGNVLNNFYEFSLFNRIESLKGKITDSIAHENIMGIIGWYKSVTNNPESTKLDHYGYTNKRWSSYEKAPIEHLLELKIPVYAYFATEDESTPIETAYLIPIQYMQKRKGNLTFNVCLGCNHSYQVTKNGKKVKKWPSVFKNFIEWTDIKK